MLPLKNIFNKIFWDERVDRIDFVITFVHRGAPSDSKTITASQIRQVGRSWFTYSQQDQETLIPMHRILTVENVRTGEILWRKRGTSNPT